MKTKEEKLKLMANAISGLEKSYGKGIVMSLGDKPDKKQEIISSGSLALNAALGVGGYPKGRIIELYGGESSGKTTLTIHAIAECQKAGGIAAFIDVEHAFDPSYATALGVNIDELFFCQPSNAEEALEILDNLVSSGAVDMIVLDSVAALVPKSELEGEMGDSSIGLQARLMSKAMRKLTGSISKTNTTAFFINQTREKIGVMYGNPTTTSGGNALKFFASVRLEVRKSTQSKEGENVTGNLVVVKVVKNKVAPPFKVAEFSVVFGKGIDKFTEMIDMAIEMNIIVRAGAWFKYNGDNIGQGKNAVITLLSDNPELYTIIENQVKEKL